MARHRTEHFRRRSRHYDACPERFAHVVHLDVRGAICHHVATGERALRAEARVGSSLPMVSDAENEAADAGWNVTFTSTDFPPAIVVAVNAGRLKPEPPLNTTDCTCKSAWPLLTIMNFWVFD